MYIEKRWILPGMLMLLAAAGLLVAITVALRPAATSTRTIERVSDVTPTTPSCPTTVAAAATPVTPAATTTGSPTQINTRGFGDIGMQLQNTNVNAPITNIHISNTASGSATIANNVNVGSGNTISTPATTGAGAATPTSSSTPSTGSTPTGSSGPSTTGSSTTPSSGATGTSAGSAAGTG